MQQKSDNKVTEKEKRDREIVQAIILILGVTTLWVISWIAINIGIEPDHRGIFGDKFGAVNALFSGLAFAGVIYAILLQRKELKLQREELKFTRKELEGQKEQLKAQNDTFTMQSIQSSFFEMLRFFRETTTNTKLQSVPVNVKGLECFKEAYLHIERLFSETDSIPDEAIRHEFRLHLYLNDKFSGFKEFKMVYLNNLFSIFDFIHSSPIENRQHFINIARIQLSAFELVFVFYECLFGVERERYKILIENYGFFSSLDTDLITRKEYLHMYEDEAYTQNSDTKI